MKYFILCILCFSFYSLSLFADSTARCGSGGVQLTSECSGKAAYYSDSQFYYYCVSKSDPFLSDLCYTVQCKSPYVNDPAHPTTCLCPEGTHSNTIITGSGTEQNSCIDDDDGNPPDECVSPNVKNIDTGNCEPKTECIYPQKWDYYSNSCQANPNNCSEGAFPDPLNPGHCIAYGDTSCPEGYHSVNDGLQCAPDGNTSSAPTASAPATSAASNGDGGSGDGGDNGSGGSGDGGGDGGAGNNLSSTPSSFPSSSGNGSGGNGNASAGNTSASGTASSGGVSSVGAGDCDPTAKNYFKCINGESRPLSTGDKGQFSGGVNDAISQAESELQTEFNNIRQQMQSALGVSIQGRSGSLDDICNEIKGATVCMGIGKFTQYLTIIGQAVFLIAAVLSFSIVLRR